MVEERNIICQHSPYGVPHNFCIFLFILWRLRWKHSLRMCLAHRCMTIHAADWPENALSWSLSQLETSKSHLVWGLARKEIVLGKLNVVKKKILHPSSTMGGGGVMLWWKWTHLIRYGHSCCKVATNFFCGTARWLLPALVVPLGRQWFRMVSSVSQKIAIIIFSAPEKTQTFFSSG
jgi:hypothetical protein